MIRNRILERRVPPKNPLFAGLNPALINKSGKSEPTGDAERQSIALSTPLPAHGSQQLDSRFNALGNFSARNTAAHADRLWGALWLTKEIDQRLAPSGDAPETPSRLVQVAAGNRRTFRAVPRRVVPNFSADCCKQATTRQSGGLRSRCPGPNRQPTLDRGDSLLGGRPNGDIQAPRGTSQGELRIAAPLSLPRETPARPCSPFATAL
jgi:hypothetical protein